MNLQKLHHKVIVGATALALLLPLTLGPDVALAKGGNQNRERFYGIVQSKPAGLQGTWKIGGRTVTASRGAQFDQSQGPLVVGACAKVDIRNGKVHEIDSEPMRNCR